MIKNDLPDMLNNIVLPPEANYQLADPQLVAYYKNYKDRIIYLDKDIDSSLFDETKLILQWNREDEEANIPVKDRKPIKILIYSYGGDLDVCFSFIDIIQKSKTPIITVNMGIAMSCGCIILLSGHKRYCMPLSTALIHEGAGGASGTYNQVQAQNENYKHMMDTLKSWIMDHTSIDKAQMNKWKNKEIYLYAEDQVKYKVVDSLVEDISEIL